MYDLVVCSRMVAGEESVTQLMLCSPCTTVLIKEAHVAIYWFMK